jgi:RimJ/RimL family protein N-acetyltransferase
MSHELHLRLETARLLLRPMVADDLDALLLIFTDPRVMASFGGELFIREQMQGWLDRNLRHQEQFGYGLFSMILKDTGELIGDCGLEQMDVEGERVAELGYDLRSDHWNRGLATEAACAVRDFAFAQLSLNRLVSLIRVGNLPSKRVAEKVGMSLLAEITRYENRYWEYGMQRPR